MMTRVLVTSLLATSSILADQVRVYVGTDKESGIYQAMLDVDSGALTSLRLAVEARGAGFIALHPSKPFLYATAQGEKGWSGGGVAAYAVKEDGSLQFLNKQPSEGRDPCHVSVDASGQMLVVANYSGGSIAAFKIKEDGSLAESHSIHKHVGSGEVKSCQKSSHPHSSFFNPANSYLYAPDLGADKVFIYRAVPEEGVLVPEGAAVVPGGGMGPRHMKWSSNGEVAYVLSELTPAVSVFSATGISGGLTFEGTLLLASTERGEGGFSGAEICLHPNGRFMYVSNRDLKDEGRDTISLFRTMEHEEGLALVEDVSSEVAFPRNFSIDPSGRWMLVAGQRSHDLALFGIDAETGRLTFTGHKISVEGDPICVVFDPGN